MNQSDEIVHENENNKRESNMTMREFEDEILKFEKRWPGEDGSDSDEEIYNRGIVDFDLTDYAEFRKSTISKNTTHTKNKFTRRITDTSEVNLSKCGITILNSNFRKLKNVRELYLSRNQLEMLTNLPPNLKSIQALDNKIRHVECNSLIPVVHLALGYNCIETLNGWIKNMPLIEYLDLSFNNISDIEDLIQELQTLKRLHTLRLRGNPCTLLPNFSERIRHEIPNVRVLDGCEISTDDTASGMKESDEAPKDENGEDATTSQCSLSLQLEALELNFLAGTHLEKEITEEQPDGDESETLERFQCVVSCQIANDYTYTGDVVEFEVDRSLANESQMIKITVPYSVDYNWKLPISSAVRDALDLEGVLLSMVFTRLANGQTYELETFVAPEFLSGENGSAMIELSRSIPVTIRNKNVAQQVDVPLPTMSQLDEVTVAVVFALNSVEKKEEKEET